MIQVANVVTLYRVGRGFYSTATLDVTPELAKRVDTFIGMTSSAAYFIAKSAAATA